MSKQIVIKIDITENDVFCNDAGNFVIENELEEVLRIVKTAGDKIERNYDQLFSPFQRGGKGAKLALMDLNGNQAGSIHTK